MSNDKTTWRIDPVTPAIIRDLDDSPLVDCGMDEERAKDVLRDHNAIPQLVAALKAAALHVDKHSALEVCNCEHPGKDFDCEACSEVQLRRELDAALVAAGEEAP